MVRSRERGRGTPVREPTKILPSPRRRRQGWATATRPRHCFARQPRWSRIRCVRRVRGRASQQEAVPLQASEARRQSGGLANTTAARRSSAVAIALMRQHRTPSLPRRGAGGAADVASKKQMGRHAICRRRWASSCCRRHAIRSAKLLASLRGDVDVPGLRVGAAIGRRRQFLELYCPWHLRLGKL